MINTCNQFGSGRSALFSFIIEHQRQDDLDHPRDLIESKIPTVLKKPILVAQLVRASLRACVVQNFPGSSPALTINHIFISTFHFVATVSDSSFILSMRSPHRLVEPGKKVPKACHL